MMGGPGGPGGAVGQNLPEFSSAIRWIYNKGGNKKIRLEFVINEDGRINQISVAAPIEVKFNGARTSRGIMLGSAYNQVLTQYGFPEKTRIILPEFRFTEAYYTRDYHAAFAFDNNFQQRVVRITIALAD